MNGCLACGGEVGASFFEIPNLPLVDSFCATREAALQVARYRIDIVKCRVCDTIQIDSPPDTSYIYENYIYESSSSPDLESHFSEYAQFVSALQKDRDGSILEIGANDGLFLKSLIKAGFRNLVAVDPSPQTSLVSLRNVKIVNKFFNHETMAGFDDGSFTTIIANNCFSHIPNLTGVLGLCAKLLSAEGVLIVEVQSTLDLIEGAVFDYIYHEHYFYHTVGSFENLAKLSGLEIFCVKHVSTKGGSYRFLLGRPGGHPIDSSVAYWKYREAACGVNSVETWARLVEYLKHIKKSLNRWIDRADYSLLGYGACATGTVFMSYMGLESKIEAIVDDNPKRQGLFAPGTGIPVLSLEQAEGYRRCLVLAWRHSSLIVPKLTFKGLSSFVPLPVVSIYGN